MEIQIQTLEEYKVQTNTMIEKIETTDKYIKKQNQNITEFVIQQK